jgi:DHA3 family macrolide efflux protein-like MFS transporter
VPTLGVFLGLGLGLLAGGRIDNFADVRLRWLPALVTAVVARFMLDGLLAAGDIPDFLRIWLVLATYLLLTAMFLSNRTLPGMTAAALGTAANGIAIVANGGWMPVWQPSLAAAGLDSTTVHSSFHALLTGPVDTGFFAHGGPLVDIIPIPIPIPMLQSVASVGDMLLGAGLAFFVFAAAVRSPALVPAQLVEHVSLAGALPYAPAFPPAFPSAGVAAEVAARGPLRHPYVRLAGNGAFSAMWLSQVVSSLGDRIHQVALVFLVARATNSSPLALGLVFAAMTVPSFLVGPVAGALVDRWDRKHVMVGSDLLRAAIVGIIPVASGLHVGLVVALVFVLAAVSSFFRPARAAALPRVVPEEDLLTANSAMWVADTATDLVGYGLGGLFVAFLGSSLALAFWLDGASYLASAALVAAIAIPPLVRSGAGAGEGAAAGARTAVGVEDASAGQVGSAGPPGSVPASLIADLLDGWRFLRAETVLFAITVQAAVAEFGTGALTALSPLLIASLALGSTDAPTAYGLFEMVVGGGLVGGGIVLGGLATRIPKGPSIIAAFTALGVAMVALAATQNLPVALILAVAVGLANVTFVVPSQTLFQQRTPDEMLGRVVAIRLAVVNGVLAVAMVTSGALAQLVGFRPVIAVCGILTVAAGLAGLTVRSIRHA